MNLSCVTWQDIPARLHRDFARVHELVLHCWEVTHKTWALNEDTRSDLALSRKTLAMFLMLLYFPRLLTTIDTASPDSAMSQLKSNFDLFLEGKWHMVVSKYMLMSPRSSSSALSHSPEDLSPEGSDPMATARRQAPAARVKLQEGQPSKATSLTSLGRRNRRHCAADQSSSGPSPFAANAH